MAPSKMLFGAVLTALLATAAVPVGWILIVVRALQDIAKVVSEYRRGEDFNRALTFAD